MLVLTRHSNENNRVATQGDSIIIDGKTVVRVLAVRGEKVRLGIEAPREIRVDRLEVHNERLRLEEQEQEQA